MLELYSIDFATSASRGMRYDYRLLTKFGKLQTIMRATMPDNKRPRRKNEAARRLHLHIP